MGNKLKFKIVLTISAVYQKKYVQDQISYVTLQKIVYVFLVQLQKLMLRTIFTSNFINQHQLILTMR